ncbi:hypothetical protein VTK73DRAFT_7479 [Phialemonium thermophilum]|uniref:FAR1 domain-containing protein n=1 Tax=Phialemonium thermophilum TaxID=223376 RepID=A0ABR3XS77_9PEZI
MDVQSRRKRARVSENGVTPGPGWPAEAVRAPEHDTGSSNPTFAPHQLNRSHQQQVADTEALMNGYSAPHSQYPDPSPPLAQASHDIPGLTSNATQPQNQQHHRRSAAPISNTSLGNADGVHIYGVRSSTPQRNAAAVAAAAAAANRTVSLNWGNPSATPNSTTTMPPSPISAPGLTPGPNLAPPPEGIYRSFDDLLTAVQRVAKDQGYGVVKLRASNYRDGKPTRYDLVCDRGGVKYNSTAKKRNPSTRKVDCPWRAKAVCEVQLNNQWRFAVQEARHNHEPRLPTAVIGQENTSLSQTMRTLTNRIDRLGHDLTQGFSRLEMTVSSRLDDFEKRLEALENGSGGAGRGPNLLGGAGGTPNMGTPSMPSANMGGPGLGNNPLANGGMSNGAIVDNRLSNIEARVSAMEHRAANGMEMNMMDEDSGQLTSIVI